MDLAVKRTKGKTPVNKCIIKASNVKPVTIAKKSLGVSGVEPATSCKLVTCQRALLTESVKFH